MQEYTTLNETAFGEYEEKRSRFIGLISHIETEAEAAAVLAEVRSRHYDARHSCYAYILKDGTARFSDDGEPHGTAGKPILEVLGGSGIVDAIIVVTRYFGGVLLGTGGLVRAYTAAAKAAVENAALVVMSRSVSCAVSCGYSDFEYLKKLIEAGQGVIIDTEFTDEVKIYFSMKTPDADAFEDVLREKFSATLNLSRLEEKFAPFLKK